MFIRTNRLFLRPFWPEDAEAILTQVDQGIARNLATMPWPYARADAERFVTMERAAGLPSLAVTLPGTGVIGSAGLGPDPDTGMVQTGYWIARAHWGAGYATEALRGVLEIATMLGHRRLTASHFLDNPASGRVLEKAGFIATGQNGTGESVARPHRDPVRYYAIALGQAATPPVYA